MPGFALLGLAQWPKRNRILCVDRSSLVLGGFYIIVIAAYIFFELVVGRLLSGVHWVTDIIDGILLSAGLVMMYDAVLRLEC